MKFPGTQMFITVFTEVHHCHYPESEESSPHLPTLFPKIHYHIIFRFTLPSGLFPTRFRSKFCWNFSFLPCPAHHTLLHLITLIIFGDVYSTRVYPKVSGLSR